MVAISQVQGWTRACAEPRASVNRSRVRGSRENFLQKRCDMRRIEATGSRIESASSWPVRATSCVRSYDKKLFAAKDRSVVAQAYSTEYGMEYGYDIEAGYLDNESSFRHEELVQWYPGHIARAERLLKESLKLVDVVIEVRDARIPLATTHPQVPEWVSNREHIVVLNREDLVTAKERDMWKEWFEARNQTVLYTNARLGKGIQAVARSALVLSRSINAKRRNRGLNPRAVRVAVIGFPNVGKSALINRLCGKKMCASAARPGVTRQLRWVRVSDDLDLLDSPGVLPPRLSDQAAAARLAMCDDIGEAAYTTSLVATAMLMRFQYLQGPGGARLRSSLKERYNMDLSTTTPEEFVEEMANDLFKGDKEAAGTRLLMDYRKGRLGNAGLEDPPTDYRWA